MEHDRTVALVKPVALTAKPAPERTFNPGLVELWGEGPTVRGDVRQPRHFIATAKKLQDCFPDRDYRTVTFKDAIFFAKWLDERQASPRQPKAITSATPRACSRRRGTRCRTTSIPFDKVAPVATYEQGEPGKFSYEQLRALVTLIDAKRWGDNRIEKRHEAARWLVRLAIYTGQRIGALGRRSAGRTSAST